MLIASYAALLAFVAWASYRTLLRGRDGLLIALAFTTLALDALPVHLMPVKGGPLAIQIGVTLLALSSVAFRRRGRPLATALTPYAFMLTAFWLLVMIYALVPVPLEYGLGKGTLFLVKCVLPLLAFGVIAPFEREDCETIARTLVWAAVLLALNILSFADMNVDRAVLRDDVGPIALARVLGQGVLVALLIALFNPAERWRQSLGYLALLPLIVFALLTTGTRGPLVGLSITVVAAFCFAHAGLRPRLRGLGRLVVGGALVAGLVTAAPPDMTGFAGVKRLLDFSQSVGENKSDKGRIDAINLAMTGIVESGGLGIGTGRFADVYGEPGRQYPHNLLVEVALEQGVPGLLMLAGLAALSAWRVVVLARSDADIAARALVALLFYGAFNAQVSGDLPVNAPLWLAAGLLWLIRPPPRPRALNLLPPDR